MYILELNDKSITSAFMALSFKLNIGRDLGKSLKDIFQYNIMLVSKKVVGYHDSPHHFWKDIEIQF